MSIHGGVQYSGGYHEYTGGYHDECGGIFFIQSLTRSQCQLNMLTSVKYQGLDEHFKLYSLDNVSKVSCQKN